jgi:hypothetical protein
MVRARLARVSLAAALGLACGCSTPCGCPGTGFGSRLASLFHHDHAVGGEVVASPGCCEGPGLGYAGPGLVGPGEVPDFGPVPGPTFTPPPPAPLTSPLVPAPQPVLPGTAQPMPYQP